MMLAGIAHEVRNPLAGMSCTRASCATSSPATPRSCAHVQRIERELGAPRDHRQRLPRVRAPAQARASAPATSPTCSPRCATSPSPPRSRATSRVRCSSRADAGARRRRRGPAAPRAPQPRAQRGAGLRRRRHAARSRSAARAPTARCWSTVRDTGAGIDPDDRSARSGRRSTPRKQSGTGLGLAFVRDIARDHGARLAVDSAPGRGTTFTLALLRRRRHDGDDPDHRRQRDDPRRPRARRARRWATLPIVAASGKDGHRARSSRRRADFVITDLKMEGIDGVEVLRAVRELDPDCPVMIITALRHRRDRGRGDEARRLRLPHKPFAPEVVRLKVERALELRAARRAQGRGSRPRTRTCAATRASALRRARRRLPSRCARSFADRRAGRADRHRRSSSTARPAPARSWSRARIHTRSQRAQRAVHQGQLRRAPRDAARERAVRPREGRVHRRHQAQARPLRAGRRRHAVPRRDRRHARRRCRPSCCACCRSASSSASAASETIKVDVRVVAATNRDLASRGRRRALPRGSVLPAERRADHAAAAARAQGATSRCSSTHFIAQARRRRPTRASRGIDDAALARLVRLSLAGQRARARERHRAGARVRRRRATRPRRCRRRCRGDACGGGARRSDALRGAVGRDGAARDPRRSRAPADPQGATRRPSGVKTETARLLGIKTSALYYKLEKYGIG